MGLLARAASHRIHGERASAEAADLDEAEEIAECGHMLLHLADVQLERTLLQLATGEDVKARQCLDAASELVERRGYGRRRPDVELLEEVLRQRSTRNAKKQAIIDSRRKKIVPEKHVFLSYCRENADQVERLRQDLIAAGLTVWWDQDILPGQDWKLEIQQAIKKACAVVLCLSEEATAHQKSDIFPEARDAIGIYRQYRPGGIFLIPARLSDCEIPPIMIDDMLTLDGLQYIDLFPEQTRQRGLDRLVEAIRAASDP